MHVQMYCDWFVLLFMTAQVTDTVEETFIFGSDPISDEDTTLSDNNNNCYFNSDRRWKGVGGFLNRDILVKEE